MRLPAFSLRAVVVPRRRPAAASPSTRNQALPSRRSAASADAPPSSTSGVVSAGIRPIPRTRMFGISMSESSNRREYSRSWMSWKSARIFSIHASSIAPRGRVDAELVALAEVPALGDPLDQDPVGRDAVLLELRRAPRPRAPRTASAAPPRRASRAAGRSSRRTRRPCRWRAAPSRRRCPGAAARPPSGVPTSIAICAAHSGPGAALGDEREVARVEALAHRVLLDRLHHRVREDLDGAHRRLLDAHPERLRGPLLERLARAVGLEGHAAAEEGVGHEPAEVHHRVGRRRLGAAAAVRRRAGHGARRARADAEDAAAVDVGDRAAAGADRVDVDHRDHRLVRPDLRVEQVLHPQLAVLREADVGRRAADVERDHVVEARPACRPRCRRRRRRPGRT